MAQQFCGEGVLDNSKFIFKYFQNIDDLIYLNDAFDKKRKRQFLKNLIVKLVASLPEAQNDARQFTHMHTHPYYYIGTLTYQWPHLRVVCSGNGSMILDIAKCTEHKKSSGACRTGCFLQICSKTLLYSYRNQRQVFDTVYLLYFVLKDL